MMTESNMLQLEIYKNRLSLYYEAERKVLEGQAYTLGSMSLTRANLSEIRKTIKDLESRISALEERGTTKRRVCRIIPRDY